MKAYYNENDRFAAAWLRELIKAGCIAEGIVDERSIEDVTPKDLEGFTQHHFFAGIGGWSYALRLAGWPDDKPAWTGSCPCQPFSSAGKRKGTADERHLWPAWHWLIGQSRPGVIFGEQVASVDGRSWLDLVSTDLEAAGYACGPILFPACGVGANHRRKRIWFVADSDCARLAQSKGWAGPARKNGRGESFAEASSYGARRWAPESKMGRVVYGVSANVGAVRGFGNAIVPQVAAEVIKSYMEIEKMRTRAQQKALNALEEEIKKMEEDLAFARGALAADIKKTLAAEFVYAADHTAMVGQKARVEARAIEVASMERKLERRKHKRSCEY